MKYRKSEIGWVMNIFMGLLILFLSYKYVHQLGDRPMSLITFLIIVGLLTLIISLFYKLTVELEGSTLRLTYGIGLIKIRFKIDDIIASRVIRMPFYYGLGIRITPKGMLYNIQSSKAVEINYMRNNRRKKLMVGTPEPEKLKQALDENFKKIEF